LPIINLVSLQKICKNFK